MSETQFRPKFSQALIVFATVSSAAINTDSTSDTYGHFIVTYADGTVQDFGIVTAYAAAKAAGYTGTEAEWAEEIASVKRYTVNNIQADSNYNVSITGLNIPVSVTDNTTIAEKLVIATRSEIEGLFSS